MSISTDYQTVGKLLQPLLDELEQARRERDAAIRDMQLTAISPCETCAHHPGCPLSYDRHTQAYDVACGCTQYVWRGIQEELTT